MQAHGSEKTTIANKNEIKETYIEGCMCACIQWESCTVHSQGVHGSLLQCCPTHGGGYSHSGHCNSQVNSNEKEKEKENLLSVYLQAFQLVVKQNNVKKFTTGVHVGVHALVS